MSGSFGCMHQAYPAPLLCSRKLHQVKRAHYQYIWPCRRQQPSWRSSPGWSSHRRSIRVKHAGMLVYMCLLNVFGLNTDLGVSSLHMFEAWQLSTRDCQCSDCWVHALHFVSDARRTPCCQQSCSMFTVQSGGFSKIERDKKLWLLR